MNTQATALLSACLILSAVDAAEEATLPLDSAPAIPTLDEMASDWLPQSQLGHYPSLNNFHGALLTNKDLLSVSWLVMPPFSQAYHSGTLYVNGEVHRADEFRWYAYQALRRKQLEDLAIETTTRMIFEDQEQEVTTSAQRWGQEFDVVFQQARDLWQQRFNDAFTPGNKHFSGNLPVLVTADEKLRRVYYMGALTLLLVHRTNLPIHERVYSYLTDSITPKMADEMVAFVERELLTKNWMRAQSLDDVAAERSDRADHGPLGAYDGWLPRTMDGMCNFGHFDKALAFLHRSEGATHEGAYAQAHELYGPNKREYHAPVRIAERDYVCRESSGGVSFANALIVSFFGYRPEFEGDKLLFSPETPRGFQGQLLHVRHKDKLYTVSSTSEGLLVREEP